MKYLIIHTAFLPKTGETVELGTYTTEDLPEQQDEDTTVCMFDSCDDYLHLRTVRLLEEGEV